MAILGKIQRKSGVLIGIIALALFAFIIQGLIKNSSSLGKGNVNVIAEVDGKKISRSEFQQQVALLQNQNRGISNMQAMKSVWDNEIKKAVLNNEYEKVGIDVGEERLRELIVKDPSIQQYFTNQQGVFDENALNEYIKRIYENKDRFPEDYLKWKNFEDAKIENEKEKIFTDLIKASLTPTLKEAEDLYHYENDAVDFKYAAVPYTTIPDSTVTVTKQDISNYISKHKDEFKADESRDIEYVIIPLEASAKDIQRVKDELKKLIEDHEEYDAQSQKNILVKGFKNTEDAEAFANKYSDVKQTARYYYKHTLPKEYADEMIQLNAGDIYGPYELNKQVYLTKVLETKMVPDSAKAAHILVAYKGAMRANPNIARSKEEAKKKADSILKIVKRNPEKFADYAKELSDGPSKTRGGDLGWFSYGQMVPEFNDFVFNGKKGKIGLVETPFGFHIIKIDDLTEPEKMLKTISIVRNIEPSTETENETFAKAAQFASEALNTDDFKKLAAEKAYKVKPVQKIGRFEDNLPGIGRNREIVRWAYKEDRKVGDVAKFDTEKGHIIVYLTGMRDEGLMTPEEASPVVKPILIKQKKAEIIKKKFTGNTFDEMAKNAKAKVGTARGVTRKNPVIPGFGKEPKVVALAFILEPKKTSSPVDGNKAVYVIQTQKVNIAPDIKNYLPYIETLKKKQSSTIAKDVVEALKKKADIEDNRKALYN